MTASISPQQKIQLLERLLESASDISAENSSDSNFKSWKNRVQRTLAHVFGKESQEFKQFEQLRFSKPQSAGTWGANSSTDHLRFFRQDLAAAKQLITELLEEIRELGPDNQENGGTRSYPVNKVFISHSSEDEGLVAELVNLVELAGVPSSSIFCSSLRGYGVSPGENFLERIRTEISGECLVLFCLSESFYESPYCLCEMGATWVQSRIHVPIVIPPFRFEDIKGVLPLTQGLSINNKLDINLLREKIEENFDLSHKPNASVWEHRRDHILGRIEEMIQAG